MVRHLSLRAIATVKGDRRQKAIVYPTFGEAEFFYYLSADEMLLNDALEHLRRGGVIPDAFGVNYGNRATLADPETVGFSAVNAVK